MESYVNTIIVTVQNYTYDLYLKSSLLIAGILSLYIGLEASIKVLLITVFFDSLTRIHVDARKKGLKFNLGSKAFWLMIESKGVRRALNKLLMQYGIYFIIAYVIDRYILEQLTIIQFQEKNYTLPVIVLWICSAIEIWSIGENIEDGGGVNIPKKVIHFFDEKYQKIFKKNQDE